MTTRNPSEAESNPNKGEGLERTKDFRGAETVKPDFDFASESDPRTGGTGATQDGKALEQTQDKGDTGAPPVDAATGAVRIKYRGQEEDVPLDKAAIMIQQFKGMSENYGPILALTNEIRKQTGIQDPNQIAGLLVDALKNMGKGQSAKQAVENATQDAADKDAAAAAGAAATKTATTGATNEAQAESATKAFFEQNGLQPTPEVFNAFKMLIGYGGQLGQAINAFPQLLNDVNQFKQTQEQQTRAAQLAAVDARAGATAEELGVNTPQHFQAFMGWVQEQEGLFPGFVQRVSTNPQIMDRAIRTWHTLTVGEAAAKNKDLQRANADKDAARASGEGTTAARPGGVTAGKPADFNRQMMDTL